VRAVGGLTIKGGRKKGEGVKEGRVRAVGGLPIKGGRKKGEGVRKEG